jgi:hypothetical protein
MKRLNLIGLLVLGCFFYAACENPSGSSDTPSQGSSPVITLLGEDTLHLGLGEVYVEPGYSAADDEDGDLTSSVTIESSIDTSYPNTSIVTYSVADSDGNEASASRSVHIEYTGLEISIDVLWDEHSLPVHDQMAISDDGSVFAYGDGNGSIEIFQADGTQTSISGSRYFSMSGDGRTIAIYSGSEVIVWQEENGIWSENYQLEDPKDNTGSRLCLVNDDGTRIVRCNIAYYNTDASIAVFDFIDGNWIRSEYLFSSFDYSTQVYYFSLSGDGKTILLGTNVVPEWFQGSISIIRETETGWNKEYSYSCPYHYENFGWVNDLSYDGSVAVVGAPQPGTNSSGGRVYFFHEHAGGWTSCYSSIDTDQTDSQYGFTVSLSDDGSLALVSAPFFDDIDYGTDTGFYHIHLISEDGIEATGGDMPLETADDIQFGYSVLLSGDGNTIVNYIAGKNRIDIGYNNREWYY